MNYITFEQFIKTFNFRMVDEKRGEMYYDTTIIRIYPDTETGMMSTDNWFEFGVYNFGEPDSTWEICKNIFTPEILYSYVYSISFNTDYENLVTIYLTKEQKSEY